MSQQDSSEALFALLSAGILLTPIDSCRGVKWLRAMGPHADSTHSPDCDGALRGVFMTLRLSSEDPPVFSGMRPAYVGRSSPTSRSPFPRPDKLAA
jgi:hypothetical protein